MQYIAPKANNNGTKRTVRWGTSKRSTRTWKKSITCKKIKQQFKNLWK